MSGYRRTTAVKMRARSVEDDGRSVRVKRRVVQQTGKRSGSKNVATRKWKNSSRLQERFDRLAGPVISEMKTDRTGPSGEEGETCQ